MYLLLISVILLLWLLDYTLNNTRRRKLLKDVPGIKQLPIIGNGLNLLITPIQGFYTARRTASLSRHRGNIFKAVVFHFEGVCLYDPEDVEVLLTSTKHIKKAFFYSILKKWIGEGLLLSSGEKWRNRRKILTPAFHFEILRQFCKTFIEQSETLVNVLQREVGKNGTEVLPLIKKCTLQVISETAMGTTLDSSQSNVEKYKRAVSMMGEVFVSIAGNPIMLLTTMFWRFSSRAKKEKVAIKHMHDFTQSVIDKRRLTRTASADLNHSEESGRKKKMAMLDLLMESELNGGIDAEGIREEVKTFMFEGHDTTAASISLILMLLAHHPEIQDRIVAEYDDIVQDSTPTIEDYNKMNYLGMCIKEGLRLYPSVWLIARDLTEDLVLKKHTIPAGVTVIIHIYDIHRNPDYYPDPNKYDPERFSQENIRTRHNYAYLAFSAGPRNCIGQKFAMLQEKIVLSSILKRFRLHPVTHPDDVIFTTDIVLNSVNEVKVKFVER